MITPKTPPGVMELLPRQQVAFQAMLDTIRSSYERFGFLPVETPVFETTDVLLTKSGGETEKQVYFVQSTGALQQNRKPELALRFDLTVPLARYVAEHERDLVFPFRRYQIQRVYRGERSQKGRYREFYQCDIDIIGKDSLFLHFDAEIPAVIHHVFTELGVGGFTINLNNRKLLHGLMSYVGVADAEVQAQVLFALDKLDKIGRSGVLDLIRSNGSPTTSQIAGVIEKLLDLIGENETTDQVLHRLAKIPASERPRQLDVGLVEITTVVEGLRAFGVPDERFRLNLAIARGLDYYTGTVYETFLDKCPGLGSVCSGGRYDDLASNYTKSRLPGVGISIGATRLFSQLLDAGLINAEGASTVHVLVTQMDPALHSHYFAIATMLRAAGLNTEVQIEPVKIGRQLKYASRAGIPLVLLMGPDEQARGTVTLKHLATGTQREVALKEAANEAKNMLAGL
ncbi:MAG: histidine--tRNA ligase [Rhodospirillaceae bacterium]